jgi:hypothetical protein
MVRGLRAGCLAAAGALGCSASSPEPPRPAPRPPVAAASVQTVPSAPAAPPAVTATAAPAAAPPEPEPPKVYSVGYVTWIFARPDTGSRKLGMVRTGHGVVLRGDELRPASDGCRRGWRGVEPYGFVCLSHLATLDPQHPIVRAFAEVAAPQSGAFPYRYAFSLGAPMYNRLPSEATHTAVMYRYPKPYRLGDWARGFEDLASSEPITADGEMPSFYQNGGRAPNGSADLVRKDLPHGSMLSWVRAFEHAGRVWLVAADLSLVPADRVRAYRSSQFRGIELSEERRLPLAWARLHARPELERTDDGSFRESGESLSTAEPVALTGREARWRRDRYYETSGGRWLRADHVRVARARKTRPEGVGEDTHWVYLSLVEHTLVAYRGMQPVFATLHSPGRGGTHAGKGSVRNYTTPLGGFHVNWKERWGTMSPDHGAPRSFWISDVMWTQYFKQPYALHGAYWHERFGEKLSAGCPNLAPLDAAWLFEFTEPPVPDGWHAAAPSPGHDGSLVLLGP